MASRPELGFLRGVRRVLPCLSLVPFPSGFSQSGSLPSRLFFALLVPMPFPGLPVRPAASAGSAPHPVQATPLSVWSPGSALWFISPVSPSLPTFGFFFFQESLLGKTPLWALNYQGALLGSNEKGFDFCISASPWLSAAAGKHQAGSRGPVAVGRVTPVSPSPPLHLSFHP